MEQSLLIMGASVAIGYLLCAQTRTIKRKRVDRSQDTTSPASEDEDEDQEDHQQGKISSHVIIGASTDQTSKPRKVANEKAVRTINGTYLYLPTAAAVVDYEISLGKPGALLRVMTTSTFEKLSTGFNLFPVKRDLVTRLSELHSLIVSKTDLTELDCVDLPERFYASWPRLVELFRLYDSNSDQGVNSFSQLFFGLMTKTESRDKASLLDCARNRRRPDSLAGRWFLISQDPPTHPYRTIEGRDFIVNALENLALTWSCLWFSAFLMAFLDIITFIKDLPIMEGPADVCLLFQLQSTLVNFTSEVWTSRVGVAMSPTEASELLEVRLGRWAHVEAWSIYPHATFYAPYGELALAALSNTTPSMSPSAFPPVVSFDPPTGGPTTQPKLVCYHHVVHLLGIERKGKQACTPYCRGRFVHPSVLPPKGEVEQVMIRCKDFRELAGIKANINKAVNSLK
jgi:hypothetical protein